MFGLSIGEIVVVILCIVIFVKPSDMPEFLREIKSGINRIKALFRQASGECKDIKKLIALEDDIDIDRVNQEITEIIGDDGNRYIAYDVKSVLDDQKNGK